MSASYAIVIDTNQYAGDFCQGLYCYTTGLYTPAGLWNEIADSERASIKSIDWFGAHAVLQQDHQGLENPVSAWTNPSAGGALNSVAMFFESPPSNETLQELMSRVQMYCLDNNIGFQKIRVLEIKNPVLQINPDALISTSSASTC